LKRDDRHIVGEALAKALKKEFNEIDLKEVNIN